MTFTSAGASAADGGEAGALKNSLHNSPFKATEAKCLHTSRRYESVPDYFSNGCGAGSSSVVASHVCVALFVCCGFTVCCSKATKVTNFASANDGAVETLCISLLSLNKLPCHQV